MRAPAAALLAAFLVLGGLAAPLAGPASAPDPVAPEGMALARAALDAAAAPGLAEALARAFAVQGTALPPAEGPAPALGDAIARAQQALARDPAGVPAAAREVARAVDALLLTMPPPAASVAPCAALDARPLLCIAGDGPDVHQDEALVILDQGGDDIWLGTAGGAGLQEVRVAVDLGGRDTYLAQPAANGAAQGAARGGIGLLWDRGDGDDTYTCLGAGAAELACQGSALLDGVGLLLDEGGRDAYTARLLAPITAINATAFSTPATLFAAQGAAANHDIAGNAGFYQGLGALLDAGSGDDAYDAFGRSGYDIVAPWALATLGRLTMAAQGGGVGGAGLLADLGGHDDYLALGWGNTTACAIQGAGLFVGQGALADATGDDTYALQCGQFQALHPPDGRGALLIGGNINVAAQGSVLWSLYLRGVRDVPVHALLADLGGNDRYFAHAGQVLVANSTVRAEARTQANWFNLQGGSLEGAAQLLDLAGDDAYVLSVEDTATANSPTGRAAVHARDTFVHGQGGAGYGHGFLTDLGGRDDYRATAVLDGRITGAPITPPANGITLGKLHMGVQGAGDQRVQSIDQEGLGLLLDLDQGQADSFESTPYDPTCQPPVIPREMALMPDAVLELFEAIPRLPVGGARGEPVWFDCDLGGMGIVA